MSVWRRNSRVEAGMDFYSENGTSATVKNLFGMLGAH